MFASLWMAATIPGAVAEAPASAVGAREQLRQRLESGQHLAVGDDAILAEETLRRFYEDRAYAPAWSDARKPLSVARDLQAAIRGAALDGFEPDDYHLEAMQVLLDRGASRSPISDGEVVDLDLLLTDAFLTLGSHLLAGRINPETIDPEWIANRRGADLASVLAGALASRDVGEALEQLRPPQAEYRRLRELLAAYRGAAASGGWPRIEPGPVLKPGDEGPRVVSLARRLSATGDLEAAPGGADEFDAALEGAVRGFQRRHGLEADGVVGPLTLAALNRSARSRVEQILVNLERWRWLPQDLGARYILVNIAGFDLEMVEHGERVMDMRVVVGRSYRKTPVFSGRMTYLVLNPFWEVPPGIAAKDVLPAVRKDVGYLAEKKIKVLRGWGADERAIDPLTVDWARVSASGLSYRFRQDPGPQNSLGRVKFMFPNRFNVYLHDTPARELFERPVRTFSSGCIRVERPVDLAARVLLGDSSWSPEAVQAAIDSGATQTVALASLLHVHLLYWTAWIERDGTVHFRDDIYGRDQALLVALDEEPPDG